MKTFYNSVALLFLILCISAPVKATVMQADPNEGTLVTEIEAGTYNSTEFSTNYSHTFSPWGGLDHSEYYVWALNDYHENADLSAGLDIVFHNIENWRVEENWLNLWFFDDATSYAGVNSGWNTYSDGSGWFPRATPENQVNPDWSAVNATHMGTWSYEDTTMDVVFSVSGASLIALMQNGGTFGIGIDPDCHFTTDKITIESAAPVPEPATILLIGIGLIGLAGTIRKKNS